MSYLNMYYTFCTKAGHFCTWFHIYLIIYLTPQVLILMTIIQLSRGSFSGRCTSLGMFCDGNDGVWIIDHRNCLFRQFSSPLYPIYYCPLSSFTLFPFLPMFPVVLVFVCALTVGISFMPNILSIQEPTVNS